jgi:hypothetical protein
MSEDAGRIAETWLPLAQFRERHENPVHGPPEAVIETLAMLDDSDDMLVRIMLQLREAPVRLWDLLGGQSALKGRPRFGLHEFIVLERRTDALVLGLAGRFWRLDFGIHRLMDPTDFGVLREPGVARLVMVYALAPRPDGLFDLATETRVHCPDQTSRLLFAPYWFAIRMASGLIRHRILNTVGKRMSRHASRQLSAAKSSNEG